MRKNATARWEKAYAAFWARLEKMPNTPQARRWALQNHARLLKAKPFPEREIWTKSMIVASIGGTLVTLLRNKAPWFIGVVIVAGTLWMIWGEVVEWRQERQAEKRIQARFAKAALNQFP
jgi:hypothetical protein